jgi:hypothetical protein
MALVATNHNVETEFRSGEGILHILFQAANGTTYVIEMKYVSGQHDETKKEIPKDQLREQMEKAASKALEQIEEKKYARRFQDQGKTVYKTAVVIGHKSDVLVVFEKEDN